MMIKSSLPLFSTHYLLLITPTYTLDACKEHSAILAHLIFVGGKWLIVKDLSKEIGTYGINKCCNRKTPKELWTYIFKDTQHTRVYVCKLNELFTVAGKQLLDLSELNNKIEIGKAVEPGDRTRMEGLEHMLCM